MALGLRWLLQRVLLFQVRRGVSALNAGDYRPLLAGFFEDTERIGPLEARLRASGSR